MPVTVTHVRSEIQSGIRSEICADSVFVVSGGARGVTAECVIELAHTHPCKFILLGRSPLITEEPAWASGCDDEPELKKRIMQALLAEGNKPTPMLVQKQFNQITAQRQMRATLRAIEATGSQVEYLAVDVTNFTALKTHLAALTERFGAITGIIHGAGNLADKLIERKTEQDFEMVYAAKVQGLENLLRCVPPEQLQHLVLFSSVAGFYGNAGQADYALANEILNKSAHLIKQHYPHCHVVSINWGPWDSGMVTPELKKVFAQRNISVIPLDVGAKLLVHELSPQHNAAQVLIGSPITPEPSPLTSELRSYRIRRQLSVAANPFLLDHMIGGYPVLPATVAMTWLVNTCEQLYPGYNFTCLDGFRVMKGIVFDGSQPDELILDVQETAKTDTGEIIFEVLVWSEISNQEADLHYRGKVKIQTRLHYSGQVKVQQPLKESQPLLQYEAFDRSEQQVILGQTLYQNGTLFHGQLFQGIERTLNVTPERMTVACLAPYLPLEQQGQFATRSFNAFAADLLCQAMLVWVRHFYQAGSLPTEVKQVEHIKPLPIGERFYLSLEIQSRTETSVTANITAHSEQGEVYLRLTGAKVIISRNLNHQFARLTQAD